MYTLKIHRIHIHMFWNIFPSEILKNMFMELKNFHSTNLMEMSTIAPRLSSLKVSTKRNNNLEEMIDCRSESGNVIQVKPGTFPYT